MPDHVALALEGALLAQEAPDARARLVETMGLVPGVVARRAILRVAAAPYESDAVRRAGSLPDSVDVAPGAGQPGCP